MSARTDRRSFLGGLVATFVGVCCGEPRMVTVLNCSDDDVSVTMTRWDCEAYDQSTWSK